MERFNYREEISSWNECNVTKVLSRDRRYIYRSEVTTTMMNRHGCGSEENRILIVHYKFEVSWLWTKVFDFKLPVIKFDVSSEMN